MKPRQFFNSVRSFAISNTMTKFLSGVLLGLSVLLFASSPGHGGTAEWLSAHNEYRCMHDVPPLTWSENLARVAEDTANCLEKCTHCITHNLSENIYCAIGTEQLAVDAWYSEKNNYDYNNPIFSPITGHFINVVAKGLSEVGCTCTDVECVCVYGGYFETTPSGLNQNVLKPIRTKEACKNAQYFKEKEMWLVALGVPDIEPTDIAAERRNGTIRFDVAIKNVGTADARGPFAVAMSVTDPGGVIWHTPPGFTIPADVVIPPGGTYWADALDVEKARGTFRTEVLLNTEQTMGESSYSNNHLKKDVYVVP